jgi:hypothetical protein
LNDDQHLIDLQIKDTANTTMLAKSVKDFQKNKEQVKEMEEKLSARKDTTVSIEAPKKRSR